MEMSRSKYIAGRGQLVIVFRKIISILVCGILIAAVGVNCPRPAACAPDKPTLTDNDHTAVFSGDQHMGVANFVLLPAIHDFLIPPTYNAYFRNLTMDITPGLPYTAGIYMVHSGADGKDEEGGYDWKGANGGIGSPGAALLLDYDGGTFRITPSPGNTITGILLDSRGGTGGDGAGGWTLLGSAQGGDGGAGGSGGSLTVTTKGSIETTVGIEAESEGGAGGKGGKGDSGSAGFGGNGGTGGIGGMVYVKSSSPISTTGLGIEAQSRGGAGGAGGHGGGSYGEGGNGGTGGAGGQVIVNSKGNITTGGSQAHGIYALSQGGTGGKGGEGDGIDGQGGDGGGGGPGGVVSVVSSGIISVSGLQAQGILAQSLGGGGGDGGAGKGLAGQGGGAKASGVGGQVMATSSGAIDTKNDTSRGIFAQSVGGFSGSGGSAGGLFAYGADGNSGGAGGMVSIGNTAGVTTLGTHSDALFAQSVGGGGGSGGSGGGVITMGGTGNAGGAGGVVNIDNSGRLQTSQNDSAGIFAQSVGGGGGDGGAAISGGVGLAVALGGSAGTGGTGSQVNVTSSNDITTAGKNASGILAQSLGGGGGVGGYAISAAAGGPITCSVALGGSGGDGGAGGTVNVTTASTIHTQGENAYGILAESVGGGGGAAGYAVSAAAVGGYKAAVSIGGSSGKGGGADTNHTQKVAVTSNGDITTSGTNAHGLLAQSVGGGGGAAGYSASGSLGVADTVSFGLGGKGGSGGAGGEVNVTSNNTITTSGKMATGLLAQSVGGGGGAGGFTVDASVGVIATSVGLGGSGGTGGNAGLLNAANNAAITTSGEQGYGILAQSVGGGGGAGGYSLAATVGLGSLDFSLGGSGTAGGLGNTVTLNNIGAITTHAKGSHGILAQSVGGGGGAGGWAASGALSFAFQAGDIPIPGASLAIALGGSGGPGSDSRKVTVTNSGPIVTDQEGSNAILAQSIGGGGGDAGWATAAAVNFSAGETCSAEISVAHGGTGGAGGMGGEVAVVNSGTAQTKAKNAPGILAQSIGGGGGNGGLSVAVTMEAGSEKSSSFGASVGIGGKGGSGGAASQVFVTSSKSIATAGEGSYGINAQSIGGGGGSGGASITGLVGLTKGNYGQMQVSVGGSGDIGGNAGLVNVNSTGGVATTGNQAVGILAQSVGGGGGNGGISFNGQVAVDEAKSMSVSIGGSGKGGGNGNSVTVTSGGAVSTSGMDAHGIFAQSVGGGGGVGNFAGSGIFNFHTSEGEDINLSVNVGGAGGKGGTGGAVTVDNQNDVTTAGEGACGIFAQSIGGGGGEAGGGFTGHINYEAPESGTNWELGVSVGGNGGSGNTGGSVGIHNQGTIHTLGDQADGIFAQSVGGGGGEGGGAYDFALIVSDPSIVPEEISALAISVGGKGGTGSNGGAVTVTNDDAIITEGGYSKGILAQSIGGGGGEGGSNKGYLIRDTVIPNTVSISVGGSGGGSSNGGTVTVNNNAAITTYGEDSDGIYAQSVGGGGGIGGEGELGLIKPGIAIGGAAGAGGFGGAVNVNNSGAISTAGDGAHGIFGQSVGGGGGEAGSVARFETEFADIGLGIGWARDGGIGGDGGKVTITNTANITTAGDSAYGIFGQSVGGGGGEAGEVGYGPGALVNYLRGSVGDAGYGGAVSVSHSTGVISTSGDDSYGIFAQSAGGENAGGTVDVTVNGSILSTGADSDGICAQSIGLSGNGNIMITVSSGTVQGGPGGSGVIFMDGAYNTLNNHGTITTSDGISGSAVKSIIGDGGKGIAGNETINNYGIIIGSVDLGGGYNAFHNYMSGNCNAGSRINLGEGKLFTNEGTVTPGGTAGDVSVLTGGFTQTSTGIYQSTLSGSGRCGRLQVTDTATLGGTLKLNYGSGPFVTGTIYEILTANQVQNTFSQQDLPATPLLSLTTHYYPQSVKLTIDAQSFTTVALNSHEMTLAQHFDNLLLSSDLDLGEALGRFQTLPASDFRSAFSSLSPGLYDAGTFTTFSISRQFARTVQERVSNVRENVLSAEARLQASGEKDLMLASNDPYVRLNMPGSDDTKRNPRFGIGIDGFGQFGDVEEAGGLSGFDFSMGGVAVNLDYALSERAIAGAGFGYADTEIDMDAGFGSGDIDSWFGSIYGTYFIERAYLEGIFTYGRHAYDNSRRISIGDFQEYTESDHDADAFSGLAEGGYTFSAGNWALQPYASLFYTYLDEEGFDESGADSLDMHVGSSHTDDLASELGLRVSQPIALSSGILTPEVKAAWQYNYDIDRRTTSIAFAGAPARLAVDGRERPGSALLGAALSFTTRRGIIATLQYDGEFAEEFDAHAIFGQVRVPF